MASGISVVVCCYNSEKRLFPTLEHLINQQDISPDSWEVILINNCSTDNTVAIANNIWNSFNIQKPNFRIIDEPQAGLSYAREKGISESRFDYVIFCDDDNWLVENYVSLAFKIMKGNSLIGALGGKGYPVFENEEPPHFWRNQWNKLAVGDQSTIEGDITDISRVVYGAGMTLNKSAYKKLQNNYNFQFQVSDRIGTSLLSGGDHELCLALTRIGYRIYYDSRLSFKHFVPVQRTTIDYYKRLFTGFGMSYAMMRVYRVNKNSITHFKNDYRYIVLRCIKNMITTEAKLLFSGYYFDSDKHKYIHLLHVYYENLGQLNAASKFKNAYKKQFAELLIFNT
jgi:glycosyltransferase involved in cell wall biosynthesis